MTNYQQEKRNAILLLNECAKEIKREYPRDKPAQRQYINDYADDLQKSLPYSLTDAQRERIAQALSNRACQLHPKD